MEKKKQMGKTVVTVRLKCARQKGNSNCWALVLRSYPVIENGKRKAKLEFLNRTVTTPVWDKSRGHAVGKGQPCHVKRDCNGVIMCKSETDRESCLYADQIRKLRQHEYDIAHIYEGHKDEAKKIEDRNKEDFFTYFKKLSEQRHPDPKSPSRIMWLYVVAVLKKFCNKKTLPFEKINMRFINDFRLWLVNLPDARYLDKTHKISNNTAARYFMLFRAALRQAYLEGYLDVDIHAKAKAIHKQQITRSSFTKEEIMKLVETPCEADILKRAALFSVLTGLRLSDIKQLRWKHIHNVNGAWRVDFVQSKTKETDYLPISDQAYKQCGTPCSQDDFVFEGIKTNKWICDQMQKWLEAAGIERHLTFHCFRHTYATLQLENGTDIYTIKSMLGHTSVNTTQIYSHIVNPTLRRASDMLFIEGLTIEF